MTQDLDNIFNNWDKLKFNPEFKLLQPQPPPDDDNTDTNDHLLKQQQEEEAKAEQIRNDINKAELTKLELYRRYIRESKDQWKPILLPYNHPKCTADCNRIVDTSGRYHLCTDSGIIHDCTPSTCEYLIGSGDSMVCTMTNLRHGNRLGIERTDIDAVFSGFQIGIPQNSSSSSSTRSTSAMREKEQQSKHYPSSSSINSYYHAKHAQERREDNRYRTAPTIGNTDAYQHESNKRRRLSSSSSVTTQSGGNGGGGGSSSTRRRRRVRIRKDGDNEKEIEMVASIYQTLVGNEGCQCNETDTKEEHKRMITRLCIESWRIMEVVKDELIASGGQRPKHQYTLKSHVMCILSKTKEGLCSFNGRYRYIPLIKCISNKIPDGNELKSRFPEVGTLTKSQKVMRELFFAFNDERSLRIDDMISKYHNTLPLNPNRLSVLPSVSPVIPSPTSLNIRLIKHSLI